MHFEILVEDQSGEKALEIIVPKILCDSDTYKIRSYKGSGHIPKKMKSATEARKRILLDRLPMLLQGYGNSFKDFQAVIFIVCDLDRKCFKEFRQELIGVLDKCNPKPETRFCIAVEEGEAWLLGDLNAVKQAYPKAKTGVLNKYKYDSICGTWELLADAVAGGGSQALKKKGYQAIGKAKSEWAEKISPYIDIDKNQSSSFNYFKRKLQEMCS